MKKRFLTHLTTAVLFSLIALLGLSSCEKINPQGKEPDLDDLIADVQCRILDENYYTVEEMADLLYGPEGAENDDADLRRRFLENCQPPNDDSSDGFPTGFVTYKYEYRSYRSDGFEDWFSAFMAVGANPFGLCDQSNIYLVCPYTHTLAKECATKSKGGEEFKYFLSINNMFIMPDGQGFGSTSDKVQPYVDHLNQSRQIYDALAAGYKLYKDDKGKMKNNWKLRIIGASQGAGDAMAVHKKLDTTPLEGHPGKYLSDAWNFDYSYVCCGPYCPEATMQAYHNDGVSYYPCVVPLVLESMLECYWNSDVWWTRWKYKRKRFYTDDWWTVWNSEFSKIYEEKTMKSEDLNKYICQKLGVDISGKKLSLPLNKMLSAEMMDSKSDIYNNLLECLRKQDLTSGWTPRTKTRIYYSKKDEVVPYENTQRLIKLFGDKCEAEEAFWDGHVACCMQFMAKSW